MRIPVSSSGKIKQLESKIDLKADLKPEDAQTCFEIGELYFSEKEYNNAQIWLNRANLASASENKFFPEACRKIGVIYLKGLGKVPVDYQRAYKELIQYTDFVDSKIEQENENNNTEYFLKHKDHLENYIKYMATAFKKKILNSKETTGASRRELKDTRASLEKAEDHLSIIEAAIPIIKSYHGNDNTKNDRVCLMQLITEFTPILGLLYFHLGSLKTALRYLNIALLLKSDSYIEYIKGLIYFLGYKDLKRDLVKAKTLLENSIYLNHLTETEKKKYKEKNAKYYSHANLLLGNIAYENKKFLQAKKFYEIAKKYQCAEANYRLALLYFQGEELDAKLKKDHTQAITLLNECIPKIKNQDILNQVNLLLAKIYIDNTHGVPKDMTRYIKHLQAAADGHRQEAINLLIEYYKSLKDDVSVNQYQTKLKSHALKHDPFAYAEQCFKEEKYQEAKDIYENILKDENKEELSDEAIAKSRFQLAKILNEGRGGVAQAVDQAKAYFEQASEHFSLSHFYLQDIFLNQKDFDSSIDNGHSFLKKLKGKPNKLRNKAYYNLGTCYQEKGNIDKAIEYYRKAAFDGYFPAFDKLDNIFQDPTMIPRIKKEVAYCLGVIMLKTSHIEEFKKEAKHPNLLTHDQARKKIEFSANQDYPPAQVELAILLEKEQKFTEADIELTKAYQQKYPPAVFKLANSEMRKKNWKEAIDFFQEAIKLGHKDAELGLKQLENQLITKLLYEAKRHPHGSETDKKHSWEDEKDKTCALILKYIIQIDEKYKSFTEKKFEDYIEKEEKEKHTFFGTDLSADSDSTEESSFRRCSVAIRESTHFHSYSLFNKADHKQAQDKLSEIINGKAYDTKKAILESKYKIDTGTPSIKAKQALEEINYRRRIGDFEYLKKLTNNDDSIKFLVVQFRGISYKTTDWNMPNRRWHRKLDEINKPIFCAAAYREAKISYQQPITPTDEKLLLEKAQEIRDKLLKMRKSGPYNVRFRYKGVTKPFPFENKVFYLQDKYTKGYYSFFEKLPKLISDKIIDLPNPSSPFVSTGDIPLHALKYAYGIKPYKGHERERLRPRWNKELRAERPYSGKLYLSLHPISDYCGDAAFHHIISLNHMRKVHLDSSKGNQILPERETSFFGYIPAGRIKHTHIAKYPSFKGPYKFIYEAKYGIDQTLYELFQKALEKYPPHTPGNRRVKILLGEYLCHYHQVRLMDRARQIAREQNATLVFLNLYGEFSFDLPPLPGSTGATRTILQETLKRKIDEAEKNSIDDQGKSKRVKLSNSSESDENEDEKQPQVKRAKIR